MITRQKSKYDDNDTSDDYISAEEGIRQGLDDANNGRLRPAEEVFAEFEAAHGIHSKKTAKPVRSER